MKRPASLHDLFFAGKVGLEDVFQDETLLFNFMEYLEGRGARHLLEFILSTNNFRRESSSQSSFNSPIDTSSMDGTEHKKSSHSINSSPMDTSSMDGTESKSEQDELKSDAMLIYERFISMQAAAPLGEKSLIEFDDERKIAMNLFFQVWMMRSDLGSKRPFAANPASPRLASTSRST